MLTVENKAACHDLAASAPDDTLPVFLGGFHSPAKARFLRLISEALPGIPAFHWGDIDLGGFRISARLKTEVFPNLQPFRMDRETLLSATSLSRPLGSKAYAESLAAFAGTEEGEVFRDVISLMLEKGVKFERESLL